MIRIQKRDGRIELKTLRSRVRRYEHRYELSSENMAKLLQEGRVRETAETLKWMQNYRALGLIEKQTRMTGTRTKTIKRSTSSV